MNKPERLAPGHRMCAGCGATIGVRAVLRALHEGDYAVIGNATGCLEVSTYMYPYTAWEYDIFPLRSAPSPAPDHRRRSLLSRGTSL